MTKKVPKIEEKEVDTKAALITLTAAILEGLKEKESSQQAAKIADSIAQYVHIVTSAKSLAPNIMVY